MKERKRGEEEKKKEERGKKEKKNKKNPSATPVYLLEPKPAAV